LRIEYIKKDIFIFIEIFFMIFLSWTLVNDFNKLIILIISIIIIFLLLEKTKYIFLYYVIIAILFYEWFLEYIVFTIGSAKVYPIDLVVISLLFYVLFNSLIKSNNKLFIIKSNIFFILYLIWGFIAILRGIPKYGYSAIGESRWYVNNIIFYLFILYSFKNKSDIKWFLKKMPLIITVMLLINFISFYFLGGNIGAQGRWAFRFIFATRALITSFLLITVYYLYLNNEVKINNIFLYFFLFILTLIVIITQHRSVWIASVVGVIYIYLYKKKGLIKGFLPILISFILLISSAPIIGEYIGFSVNKNIEKSAKFIENPVEDPTGHWRITGWKQELAKAYSHPILGAGLGGYSYWFVNGYWTRVAIHNGYIMMFSKFGLIGVVLFFLGVFFWFRETKEYINNIDKKININIAVAIRILVIMHLIYAMFYDFTMFFWILLGIGSVFPLRTKVFV